MKIKSMTPIKCLMIEGLFHTPINTLVLSRNGDLISIEDTFNNIFLLHNYDLSDVTDDMGNAFANNDLAFAYLEAQLLP